VNDSAEVILRTNKIPSKLPYIWNKAKRMKMLYIMLIIPVAYQIIFHYIPMYGIIIAFKDYRYIDGFLGSKWNNFEHFTNLFTSEYFWRVLLNTVNISVLRIITSFPAPILFALLLNEIGNLKIKKITQTISYLPHFMSWVVLAGIVQELFSPQRGIVNYILTVLGHEPIYFLTSTDFFVPILLISGIWQGVGWGSILYLASLTSIDPELYQSAEIDGANRFQKAIYISLPALVPVISILFLLNLSGLMNAGFDQIFNLYNPLVYKVSDILDTYVYRMGIQDGRYDFSTAVGLFKNIIGCTLLVSSNALLKKFNDYGIW